jgi:hypothetical protein
VRDATLRALGAMNARAYLPAMLSMLKDPCAPTPSLRTTQPRLVGEPADPNTPLWISSFI